MKRFHVKLPFASPHWQAAEEDVGVIVGVDEAGRGPVLGPMVYGAAFWSAAPNPSPDLVNVRGDARFDDSKKLSESVRDELYEFISRPEIPIGFITCELSAQLLSEQMLQVPTPVSLNKIAWDCTVELIQKIGALGHPIKEIYVDTVGKEDTYEQYLQQIFPQAKVTVRSKADSLFKIVACASICAKVERDLLLKNYTGRRITSNNWGSGYPGDERTKDWLQANVDKTFGFPDIVRFSWQTTKTLLETSSAHRVDFVDDTGLGNNNNARITDMFHSNKRQCCKNVKFINTSAMLDEFGK